MRGLLQLPSDFDRAMREASNRRTVTDTDSYAFSYQFFNADERGPEARRIKMKREKRVMVNSEQLTGKAIKALAELESKGFFKDGKIVYEPEQEDEVLEIVGSAKAGNGLSILDVSEPLGNSGECGCGERQKTSSK